MAGVVSASASVCVCVQRQFENWKVIKEKWFSRPHFTAQMHCSITYMWIMQTNPEVKMVFKWLENEVFLSLVTAMAACICGF